MANESYGQVAIDNQPGFVSSVRSGAMPESINADVPSGHVRAGPLNSTTTGVGILISNGHCGINTLLLRSMGDVMPRYLYTANLSVALRPKRYILFMAARVPAVLAAIPLKLFITVGIQLPRFRVPGRPV